jgi:hypothetical protein
MIVSLSPRLLFFLLLFFETAPLFAQLVEIRGKIFSGDSVPLTQVVVLLQKQDTSQIISFTTSDEKGEWKIQADQNTDFILTFRLLGYKTLFKKISTPNIDHLYVEIALEEDSYLLGVAEIKGNSQGISISGDTLRYNLKNYTDGYEENLGDVINKLPGMEVSDQGQISYKGRRVNKLLIEGKDVLNNQHKIANTGIQADQLEALEVIENFQEFGNSSFSGDEVALNIRLKKDYLGNWTGNIENQVGVENKFNSALNLLNIKDNFSVTSFVRANNTNEAVLNAQEYLDMQGSILRWINRLGSNPDFNTLVPMQFKPFQYVQKSFDALGVINAAYSKNEKLKAKFSLLMGSTEKNTASKLTRLYINDGLGLFANQKGYIKAPIANFNGNFKWQASPSAILELHLPISIDQFSENVTQTGLFNQTPYAAQNQHQKTLLHFNPEMDYKQQIGKHWWLHVSLILSLKNEPQEKNIVDNTLLSLQPTGEDSVRMVNQHIYGASRVPIVEAHLRWKKKSWFSGVEVSYGATKQVFDVEVVHQDLPAFQGVNTYRQSPQRLNLYLGRDDGHWRFQVNGAIKNLRAAFNQPEYVNRYQFNPQLTLRYSFNRLHYLLLNYGVNSDMPNLGEITSTQIFDNSRNVSFGSYPWQEVKQGLNLSFSHFLFKLTGNLFVHTIFSYAKNINPSLISTYSDADFLFFQTLTGPNTQTYTINTTLSVKPSKFPFWFKIQGNGVWLRGFSFNDDVFTPFNLYNQLITFNLRSKWENKFNFSTGVAHVLNHRSSSASLGARQFSQFTPYLELNQKIGKGINVTSKLSYLQNGTQSLSTNVLRLQFNARWVLGQSPFSFKLTGNDVLNINPARGVAATFNPAFTELTEYQFFPGFILAGFNWNFK